MINNRTDFIIFGALNSPVVYSTDRSTAVVLVLFLLFVLFYFFIFLFFFLYVL